MEEAGMRSDKLVLWDSQQFLEKIDWAVYTFIAKECHTVRAPSLDAGEKIKLLYFSFDEFIDLASKKTFRDLEIALKIFRISRDQCKLDEMRRLFLED